MLPSVKSRYNVLKQIDNGITPDSVKKKESRVTELRSSIRQWRKRKIKLGERQLPKSYFRACGGRRHNDLQRKGHEM